MNSLFESKYDFLVSRFYKFCSRNIPIVKNIIHFIYTAPSSLYGIYCLKLKKSEDIKIVIGSSSRFFDNWIPTDISFLNILEENDWNKYFKKGSVAALLAEHVWEHLTINEAELAAKNCYKYLKPGGYIRIAVPDGYHPNKEYIEFVKPNGIGPGAEGHKVLYNYQTISIIFKNAGFKIKLHEYFDKNHIFHSNQWSNKDGKIFRSSKNDPRNIGGTLEYTSIIFDAIK